MHSKIREAIDTERLPALEDRAKLPYTEAVICEVQRFRSIVPLALAHVALHSVLIMLFHVNVSFCSAHHCSFSGHSNLLNYEILKDALVLTNLYAVHRQKHLWPAHDRFIPEANFLRLGDFKVAEEKGASVKQNGSSFVGVVRTENLVPFGVGRRQCLGESFARQELFRFFVGLLQRF